MVKSVNYQFFQVIALLLVPLVAISQRAQQQKTPKIPHPDQATNVNAKTLISGFNTKIIHINGEKTQVSLYTTGNQQETISLIKPQVQLSLVTSVEQAGNQIKNIFANELGLHLEDEMQLIEDNVLMEHKVYRYCQYHNGIKVKDAELKLHYTGSGNIDFISNSTYPINLKKATFNYNAQEAEEICKTHFISTGEFTEAGQEVLNELQIVDFESELVYCQFEGIQKLAWQIMAHPNATAYYELLVDALTGKLLSVQNKVCELHHNHSAQLTGLDGKKHEVKTISLNNIHYMINASLPMYNSGKSNLPSEAVGVIQTLNANQTALQTVNHFTAENGNWENTKATRSAVSAQVHALRVFNYFNSSPFNFNSLDGKGISITNVVNVNENSNRGADRAFWNGSIFVYGNGDILFKPLAGDIDIVAHEMTHGLIHYTARLDNKGQSGAINEAYSDIFAAVIGGNWRIGENVLLNNTYYKRGDLRNLANPNNQLNKGDLGWMASHMNEYDSDPSAIYENSGIISHAFYLGAKNHPEGISEGTKVMTDLYFSALLSLTPKASFYDVRNLVVLSAEIKYGVNSTISNAVIKSFDDVGLPAQKVNVNAADLPQIIGNDFIIAKQVSEEKTSSGLTLISGQDFSEDQQKLANITSPLAKLSITDNGKFAYMVNQMGEVRRIQLDTVSETIVSEGQDWKRVAVAKDEEKLALIKKGNVPMIYVYCNNRNQLISYSIPPTSAVRTKQNGIATLYPLSVGNLEWNYEGDKLLFECLNYYIDDNGIDTHYVWDIGEMIVWDNTTDDFGSGIINKFFPVFPYYLNMRNPTFAKNSPYIFVYDEYDTEQNINTVIGINQKTYQISEIIKTSIPASPSFSYDDKKLAINELDEEGDTVISVVLLNENKITATEGIFPIHIAKQRQIPIWFVQGKRELTNVIPPSHQSQFNVDVWPNPFTHSINIALPNFSNDNYIYQLTHLSGKEIMNGQLQENYNEIPTGQLKAGMYLLKISDGREIQIIKVSKLSSY